eukprot:m.1587290 g.1587290  ORF g.1587290 m.1587290 type:complete len:52 (-) comp25329_c0_seq13:2641-2796(-)
MSLVCAEGITGTIQTGVHLDTKASAIMLRVRTEQVLSNRASNATYEKVDEM